MTSMSRMVSQTSTLVVVTGLPVSINTSHCRFVQRFISHLYMWHMSEVFNDVSYCMLYKACHLLTSPELFSMCIVVWCILFAGICLFVCLCDCLSYETHMILKSMTEHFKLDKIINFLVSNDVTVWLSFYLNCVCLVSLLFCITVMLFSCILVSSVLTALFYTFSILERVNFLCSLCFSVCLCGYGRHCLMN